MHPSIYRITVEFGDCDPAGIVFYPNYCRWIDSATRHLFESFGAAWESQRKKHGIITMPLVEINNRFRNSATFGEEIEVESRITEMARKTFVVQHTVRRGETVLVEGREVRIFAIPHPEDAQRFKALLIPKEISEVLGFSLQVV